jgi:hypothetical protein
MKRIMWTALAFGIACDFVISIFLSWLVGNPNIFETAIWIFVALQLGRLVLGIWNGVTSWAYFFAFGKELRARAFQDALTVGQMPKPERFLIDEDEFLAGVRANDELDVAVRLSAAELSGYFAGVRLRAPLGERLRQSIALNEAIDRYRITKG